MKFMYGLASLVLLCSTMALTYTVTVQNATGENFYINVRTSGSLPIREGWLPAGITSDYFGTIAGDCITLVEFYKQNKLGSSEMTLITSKTSERKLMHYWCHSVTLELLKDTAGNYYVEQK